MPPLWRPSISPPARRLSDCAPLPTSLPLGPLTLDEFRLHGKLVARQAERFARQVLGDAGQLEHDLARLDHGDPALGVALAGAHAGLGRLLRVRLVGEDVDPDLAATFDLAGHRDTSGLDLTVGEPTALDRLEPVLAEGNGAAALGVAAHAAAELFAVLDPFRHQHQRPPPPGPRFPPPGPRPPPAPPGPRPPPPPGPRPPPGPPGPRPPPPGPRPPPPGPRPPRSRSPRPPRSRPPSRPPPGRPAGASSALTRSERKPSAMTSPLLIQHLTPMRPVVVRASKKP